MADSIPPAGGSQSPVTPPNTGRSSLVWWGRLANYVLLGGAVLMIADMVWEGIDSGKWVWYRFGLPLMFISMAIVNLASMRRQERRRAELAAAPDRGGHG